MPVMPTPLVEETAGSRRFQTTSRDRQYKISGVVDEVAAYNALIGFVPASLGGLFLDQSSCTVEEFDAGTGIYLGVARYQNSFQSLNTFSYGFDIGTQNLTLKHSYSTRHKYKDGDPQLDFKGAINVDEDGNVNGVDIVVPVMTIQMQATFGPSDISAAYVHGLKSKVGRVNSAPYSAIGADTGEALLTRVSGQRRDYSAWDLCFNFGVIENDTNLTIDGINGIEKYGWEYVWAYYRTTLDTVGGKKLYRSKAIAAFVEQVYRLADFSSLNIPTQMFGDTGGTFGGLS